MRVFALVCLFLFPCFAVHGQQITPRQEKIKILFSLMHQDILINKTFDVMASSMAERFSSEMKDTVQAKKMAEAMKKGMEGSKAAAKKLLDVDMVNIYDKYFTESEIDDFITFYKTASGQKMLNAIPDIQRETMTIMAQKYGPEIQASMTKAFEEILKDLPESSTQN